VLSPWPKRTLVGPADRRREPSRVDVVLAAAAAGAAWEERTGGRDVSERGAPGDELVAQQRREINLADASVGFRVFDVDAAVNEVDVLDVDPAELRVSQAGAGKPSNIDSLTV
jgi:hypothetical protein